MHHSHWPSVIGDVPNATFSSGTCTTATCSSADAATAAHSQAFTNGLWNALSMPFRRQRDYWRRPDGTAVLEREGLANGTSGGRLAE